MAFEKEEVSDWGCLWIQQRKSSRISRYWCLELVKNDCRTSKVKVFHRTTSCSLEVRSQPSHARSFHQHCRAHKTSFFSPTPSPSVSPLMSAQRSPPIPSPPMSPAMSPLAHETNVYPASPSVDKMTCRLSKAPLALFGGIQWFGLFFCKWTS